MMSRTQFLEWIEAQKGKPYVWAAKGQKFELSGGFRVECFDCSGLVARALLECGHPSQCPRCKLDLLGFHNAQRLFSECAPRSPSQVQPGDLMFWGAGPSVITHVMVVVDADRCFGASGGGGNSFDPVESLRLGHTVKFQPRSYRPRDFIGYRALPLVD